MMGSRAQQTLCLISSAPIGCAICECGPIVATFYSFIFQSNYDSETFCDISDDEVLATKSTLGLDLAQGKHPQGHTLRG